MLQFFCLELSSLSSILSPSCLSWFSLSVIQRCMVVTSANNIIGGFINV
jgi:hypothetical protein